MTDKKTSLLVNNQLPDFVRSEHPKFVSFLESYYEFLDQNGYGKSKDLRYISDVDQSLDEFEQQFFNSFLPFIPRDVQINKELIIKNILPMYLAKGSEKSYRLLFRMLFGEEIDIETPGNRILRASDGRWSKENFLRVDLSIRSEYTSDGEKTVYILPYIVGAEDITVYVDGVLTTDYLVRKEYRKLIFNTAPSSNSIIRIQYNNFDVTKLENTKVTGLSSGAYAIVERVGRRSTSGSSFYEFFVDSGNIFGTFENGESLRIDLSENGSGIIPIFLQTFSDLQKIDIIDGGANYNIGDSVIVRGPSTKQAIAIVDDVVSGTIEEILVLDGGSGFKINDDILSQNIDSSLFFAQVETVDSSGAVTPNTISYNTNIIDDFANVTIDSIDYGFSANGVENVNSVISQALTSATITGLGSITTINVETSKISAQTILELYPVSSLLFANTRIGDLGIIGRIDIDDGGLNYNVGEQLIFTNELFFSGQGANAVVSSVSANGMITGISILNGGLGYTIDYPPNITVNTAFGTSANLSLGSIMGTTVSLTPEILNDVLGRIISIRLLDAGAGYSVVPGIDLTRSGSGTAIAEAILRPSLVDLPGKWTTSDSILSNDDIRLQGRDYFINYSYVISSKVEFDQYKSILKNLLHPAGLINYAKFRIDDTIVTNVTPDVSSSIIKTVSGTVNITNNSNNIVGVNSQFITAESLGIIQTGNVIAIGNDTVNVVSIVSNTSITVDNVFTSTANSQIIKIVT